MQVLHNINYIVTALFIICYAYQFCFLAIAVFKKPARAPKTPPRRYGVLISARNEENVIGQLIASIKAQNYPPELIDIFVAADNCTDGTASAARMAGATVWERENDFQRGKGYALGFLFDKIKSEYGFVHDGYFIFDADNILDDNYIAEMNDTFSQGYDVVTSYRNSKNPDSSWVSSGYTLQFMRESAHLNAPRMTLKSACMVSGTGFMLSRKIVERNGGWKHFLLTEDIEFTADCILKGDRMGYCGSAVFYDEQPITFMQSAVQRLRWAKGYLQVFRKYGGSLFSSMFRRGGGSFSCFDITMSVIPAIILTTASILFNIAVAFIALFAFNSSLFFVVWELVSAMAGAYFMFFAMGAVTALTEWKNLRCKNIKKLKAVFVFPLFMISYMPIAATALVTGKVDWVPIRHTVSVSLGDIKYKE